ncbi:hypothetical protein B0H11DRAFT_1076982 [Mycena galericulata]|nr:hypothetical protein B0H11DRAFT_1076982 [Mycena galericulata]
MATLEHSAKGAVAVFPLTVEGLDKVTPKELTEILTTFLAESYETAFGTREIPWATIANEPDTYYDTAKFLFRFTSDGLAELTCTQRSDLATVLAPDAGVGSAGFFRKVPPPSPPPPSPPRSSPPPLAQEAVRLRQDAEEREAEEHEREAERLRREVEKHEEEREAEEREAEAARLRREVEEHEEEREREAARLRREEEEEDIPPPPKKTGQKRKADSQLVPEGGGPAGRPGRTRKTPQEAAEERAAKLATTVRGAGKPR